MNLDVKIQLTQPGDYVIRQLMVLKIKIGLKKSGERYGVNGVGFQGINCESAIFFNPKNNANNFVLTICKYLISRTENPKALKIISEIISSSKLEIDNVKLELLEKCMDEKNTNKCLMMSKRLSQKIQIQMQKYHINYYKINQIIKNTCKDVNQQKLSLLMKEEKSLNIFLDNAKIHKAKIVEEACEILSVNLVYLPPYCPF